MQVVSAAAALLFLPNICTTRRIKIFTAVDSKSTRFIRLKVQCNNFRLSDRAFSIYAPKVWNQLTTALKNDLNISRFKGDLKTYLFREAFNL